METPTDDGAGGATAETVLGPPLDDCCSICFGSFSVPCRSDCGHWYCASCILQYWNYSSAPKNCKCPMCSHHINMLMPEASLCQPLDEEVTKVLENIRMYNSLFVGGIRSMVQKVCGLPLFIKRIIREMMNPDRQNSYVHEVRLFAVLLVVYTIQVYARISRGLSKPGMDESHASHEFLVITPGFLSSCQMLLSILYTAIPSEFIPSGG